MVIVVRCAIWYHLCNLTNVKIKLTLVHGCFSRFLNCTNSTKSRNAPQLAATFDSGKILRDRLQILLLFASDVNPLVPGVH